MESATAHPGRLLVLRAAGFFAAYVALGWACLAVPPIGSETAVIWLPNGIALAGVYLWGRRYAVLVAAASLGLLAVLTRVHGMEAAGIAAGSALGPLAGAWLLNALRFDRRLDRQRDLGALIAASALAAVVSSGVGFASTWVTGGKMSDSPGWEALIWWLGDAIGYLTPGALLLSADVARFRAVGRRTAEAVVALCFAAGVCAVLFVAPGGASAPPTSFFAFVPLAWLALRFGIVGASAAAIIVGFFAAWGTAIGHSQFYRPDAHATLVLLWAFVLTTALFALVMSVLQSERLAAELASRASDFLLGQAFEHGRDAQIVAQKDGRIVAANPAAAALLGVERGGLEGRNWRDLMLPGDPAFAAAKRQIRETRSFRGELVFVRANGDRFLGDVAAANFVAPDGSVVAHARIVDIERQRSAERALVESRDQLAAAERIAGIGHWRYSPGTGRVTCSEGQLRNFGLDADAFAGTLEAWLGCVHPEDRATARAAIDRASRERVGTRFEFRVLRRDGAVRHLLSTVDAALPIGEHDAVFGTTLDLTDTVNAQAALRAREADYAGLTESVPGGVYRAREFPDGRVVFDFASPRFFALLGLEGAAVDDARAAMIAQMLPEDRADYERVSAAVRRGREAIEWEGRFCVGGETRWLRLRSSRPAVDPGGQVWVGLIEDVTVRKRDELRLRSEQTVFESLTRGDGLGAVLDRLVEGLEAQFPDVLASIMLLDPATRRLHAQSSGRLPAAWMAAIEGVEIGPAVGSCGTAAYTGKTVVVDDIATSPLWAPFADMALSHGLRACWSMPIAASSGAVLGTLACYYGEPRAASPEELAIAQRAAWIAALAIERAAALHGLKDSEERFRTLYNKTPAMIMSINVDGTLDRVSDTWLEMMGYTREEVIGRPLEPFIAPEMRAHFRSVALPDLLDKGFRRNTEVPYLRKDGTVIDGLASTVGVRDAEGRIVSALAVIVDISALKRAQRFRAAEQDALLRLARGDAIDEVLLALMASYEKLFPGMRCGMLRMAADGRHLDRGIAPSLPADYVEAVNGIEVRDGNCACGTSAATKRPVVCRDLATDARWADVRDVLERYGFGACWSFPLVSTQGDVLGTFSQYYAHPAEPTAEELAMIERAASIATLAIERDQTFAALRASEERYRTIYHGTPAMQHVMDADGRIVQVSDYWLETMGHSRADVVGKPFDAFVAPDPRAVATAALLRDARGGFKDVESRLTRRDGSVLDVLWSATAERGPGGEALRWYAVVTDVTDRKRAEAAQRRLELQLREAQKMEAIGTLAGGIAHDFNNIIGAIVGNVNLVREDLPPNHPATEGLDEIARASGRARDVIQQILTFSRREETERRALDVGAAVDEALKLLRPTLPASVQITTRVPARQVFAVANATQLQQVLVNLGTNAWQALDAKPGEIAFAVDETTITDAGAREAGVPQGGRYVRITVRDTGSGMTEAVRARIFEPFFTTKPAGRGTGLGLAVVHGIVQGHGGGIRCESAPGAGTTFYLYLPAASAPAGRAKGAVETVGPAAAGEGRRILFVDDDEAVTRVARRLLERAGYSVTAHTRAASALDALRAAPESYAGLVSDFNMPGMSGLDVAKAAREIRPGMPTALTSGYVTDELKRGAAELGVREVIWKPDLAAQLPHVVARLIDAPAVGA